MGELWLRESVDKRPRLDEIAEVSWRLGSCLANQSGDGCKLKKLGLLGLSVALKFDVRLSQSSTSEHVNLRLEILNCQADGRQK